MAMEAIVDTMEDTIHMEDTDTGEVNVLPTLTLKLNHGIILVITDIHPILMEAITHTLTTTLENDLLMPNLKPNHIMVMAVITVAVIMEVMEVTVTVVVTTGDKSSS